MSVVPPAGEGSQAGNTSGTTALTSSNPCKGTFFNSLAS
jgi:hypothetical protein